MIDSNTILYLGALNVRARVCVCVGLFMGCTTNDVAGLLGLNADYIRDLLCDLRKAHAVTSSLKGRVNSHHLTKVGRALIADDVLRLRGEALAIVGKARLERYARLGLLDEIEADLVGL